MVKLTTIEKSSCEESYNTAMLAPDPRLVPEVLSNYSAVFQPSRIASIGNRGGFSGAALWQMEAGGHSFCLRAWPSHQCDAVRLQFIHRLMQHARSAGLAFVPLVIATVHRGGYVEHSSRLWDLTEWLPGGADFHKRPTAARLEAACEALARLHKTWEQFPGAGPDICPALRRRLAAATEWRELRHSGWQLPRDAGDADPVRPIADRALHVLDQRIRDVSQILQPWTERRWHLQACHCDVWHDNLLFEGDRVTGLIDYGAAKIDHPATDVARMLGSLVPDDPVSWQAGLRAYRAVRQLGDQEVDFARALDVTGTVIGAATWLRWLYEEFRHFEDRAAVAERLAVLVERMEKWQAS